MSFRFILVGVVISLWKKWGRELDLNCKWKLFWCIRNNCGEKLWGIRKLWNSFKEDFGVEIWDMFEGGIDDKGCFGKKKRRGEERKIEMLNFV